MFIYLIRHCESLANTGIEDPLIVGDANIGLTENGKEQAKIIGRSFGEFLLRRSLIYCSPYKRTRETLDGILKGVYMNRRDGLKIYEDPRLREVERGYCDEDAQLPMRRRHGWFYYRHDGGESAADCYDRTSAFIESMMRQTNKNPVESVIIICHGMTIRCFVMRFLHLTVEQFEQMKNPENCDVVLIGPSQALTMTQFVSGRWAVKGLTLRPREKL